MLYRVAAAAACIVLLAGCQQAGPGTNSPGVTAPSSVAMKAVDVPFSGEVTGTLRFDVENPQACAPSPLTMGLGATGLSNATGTALHMGNVTYHTEQCLIPQQDAPTDVVGRLLVLTAANGDEIRGTFSGQTNTDPVLKLPVVQAAFTFSGGTGRFKDASGTAQMTGVLTPTATVGVYTGRWEWTGTIRY